jgi:kynurenine formamidase
MAERCGGEPTDTEVEDLIRQVTNWGRWGVEDELGTLNHLTASARAEAAAIVRDGDVISLGLELRSDYPQPHGGRLNCQHLMTQTGQDYESSTHPDARYADDVIMMAVHAATHWDALGHVAFRGKLYNGRPATVVSPAGASSNDIMPVARNLIARAVLVDVASARGVARLPRDYEILPDDLELALAAQRTTLSQGDVLLIRTGHLGHIRATDAWEDFVYRDGRFPFEPGIGASCLPWLHARAVAAVACDNWAVEVCRDTTTRLPVHEIGIVQMGLTLGEMFDLDQLAAACADDGRFEMLLAAGPLPIVGGVGGPVNPMVLR